jgi:hypothetical protein
VEELFYIQGGASHFTLEAAFDSPKLDKEREKLIAYT